MLATLSARGYCLGVFSDYPAADKLKALGVMGYFKVAVSSQDTDVRGFKPNTNGFGIAVSRLGLSPGEVLYVGDRMEVDGRGAIAAGLSVAILEGGNSEIDGSYFSIDSLADLLPMLPEKFNKDI